jgi:hypothetical protein
MDEDTTARSDARVIAASAAVDAAALVSYGQRRINLIWEITQAIVAVSVTFATLYTAVSLTIDGTPDSAAFLLLSNAFFLVSGFYFGRTNHQRIGGVGPIDGR